MRVRREVKTSYCHLFLIIWILLAISCLFPEGTFAGNICLSPRSTGTGRSSPNVLFPSEKESLGHPMSFLGKHGPVESGKALQLGLADKNGLYLPMYHLSYVLNVEVQSIREKGLMDIFMQFIATTIYLGDQLLDEYGEHIDLNRIKGLYEEALHHSSYVRLSNDLFTSSGITLAALQKPSKGFIAKPYGDSQTSIDYINSVMDGITGSGGAIDHLEIPEERKEDIRKGFLTAYNAAFYSYILEREQQSPLQIQVGKSIEILERKSGQIFAPLLEGIAKGLGVDPILLALFSDLVRNYYTWLTFADEYSDWQKDFGKQPNLALSIAWDLYPDEFRLISQRIASGKASDLPPKTKKAFLNIMDQYYYRFLDLEQQIRNLIYPHIQAFSLGRFVKSVLVGTEAAS